MSSGLQAVKTATDASMTFGRGRGMQADVDQIVWCVQNDWIQHHAQQELDVPGFGCSNGRS